MNKDVIFERMHLESNQSQRRVARKEFIARGCTTIVMSLCQIMWTALKKPYSKNIDKRKLLRL